MVEGDGGCVEFFFLSFGKSEGRGFEPSPSLFVEKNQIALPRNKVASSRCPQELGAIINLSLPRARKNTELSCTRKLKLVLRVTRQGHGVEKISSPWLQ